MAEQIFLFVILTLAIYRVALMVATEDGPFDIFYAIRDVTRGYFGDDFWITRGIYCPLCVGFWLSIFVGCFLGTNLIECIVYGLGIAGAQTFLTLQGVPESE